MKRLLVLVSSAALGIGLLGCTDNNNGGLSGTPPGSAGDMNAGTRGGGSSNASGNGSMTNSSDVTGTGGTSSSGGSSAGGTGSSGAASGSGAAAGK